MLREDFLPDYDLSVSSSAKALGVLRQTVNELLRERRSVSPEMALRLSRLFGNSPRILVKRSALRRSLASGKNDREEDREDIALERRLHTHGSVGATVVVKRLERSVAVERLERLEGVSLSDVWNLVLESITNVSIAKKVVM